MMEQKKKSQFEATLFWSVVTGLLIFALWNMRVYIVPLISAYILAYLTKPLYDRLTRRIAPSLAAALCVFLVILVIIVPLVLIANQLLQQAHIVLQQQEIREGLANLSSSPLIQEWGINIDVVREKGIAFLIELVTDVLRSLPAFLLNLVIVALGMYYMLIGWKELSRALIRHIPFKNKEETAREIDKTTRALVYGTLLVALIEFVVAALGFYISGIKVYLLLSSLIFILAFIPGAGPALVWIPLALYLFLTKNYASGTGTMITGIVISFGVEIMIRNKIMSTSTKIHPLVMLLGVFSGISAFGLFGFVLGPLLLVYALKLLEAGLKKE